MNQRRKNGIIFGIIFLLCMLECVKKMIEITVLLHAYVPTGDKKYASGGSLSMHEAAEPYSDWGKSPTGSAKYLDGSTVLVSLYLEDERADWTASDIALATKNLDSAVDFLVEEGKRYGKEVNLIYDTDRYPDLEYHISYPEPFPGNTSEPNRDEKVKELIYHVYQYIHKYIPVKEIMEEYQVDSIGFVCFIDGAADAATTYHYVVGDGDFFYEEICFLNLRWKSTAENVNPDTYAHELLHLFGAKDLYVTNMDFGISKEFLLYLSKNRCRDIMLGNAAKNISYPDRVSSEITEVTAYFLGWISYIYELDLYPAIRTPYPASFTRGTGYSGNFEEYMLPSQELSEKNVRDLKRQRIKLLICFFVFLFDVILFLKRAKAGKNKGVAAPNGQVIQEYEVLQDGKVIKEYSVVYKSDPAPDDPAFRDDENTDQ